MDAVGSQRGHDRSGRLCIFLFEQSLTLTDQRDLTAQPLERLSELAGARIGAEYQQPLGAFTQAPEVIAGQRLGRLETRDRRNPWPATGGDDDGTGSQGATVHLDFPRGFQPSFAHYHLDPEVGVVFGRSIFHRFVDESLHLRHHLGEINIIRRLATGRTRIVTQRMHQSCRTAQGPGRDAAFMHGHPAETLPFDQTHPRLE